MVAVNILKMVIPIKIHITANKRPKIVEGVRSPYLLNGEKRKNIRYLDKSNLSNYKMFNQKYRIIKS